MKRGTRGKAPRRRRRCRAAHASTITSRIQERHARALRGIQHGHPAAILWPMHMPRAIGAACFRGRHQTMPDAKRIGLEDAFTCAHVGKNLIAFSRCHLRARQHRHARRE